MYSVRAGDRRVPEGMSELVLVGVAVEGGRRRKRERESRPSQCRTCCSGCARRLEKSICLSSCSFSSPITALASAMVSERREREHGA